jgi:hypothetical protein
MSPMIAETSKQSPERAGYNLFSGHSALMAAAVRGARRQRVLEL